MIKNSSDIETFGKIQAQLKAFHEEIGMLSKKKPDGGINPFKLKLVNTVLKKANAFLGKKYEPFGDFKLFNSDDVPTNSDVVTILAQYLNCMETLRCDNICCINAIRNLWQWKNTSIRAAPPKKLKER